jgi:hypothetical protein
VPAGPGGLTPPISLAYSSAGVSENHSVQAAAGWVGEGWNLSMGSINWSERDGTAGCVAKNTCSPVWESQWQLSDPYGTGSELIPPNNTVSTYYDDTLNTYYGPSYSSTVLADNPKRYYQLNDAGTAADVSGNNHPGTYNDGSWAVSGNTLVTQLGAATTFNGSNTAVSMPGDWLPTGNSSWSMEAWIQISGAPGGTNYPIFMAMGTSTGNQVAYLQVTPSGQVRMGDNDVGLTPSGVLTFNMPHHVVGTYDGTTARLYLDGQLVASDAHSFNIVLGSAAIGRSVVNNYYFTGILDEPAFYSTTLSSAQISAHYTAGTSGGASFYYNLPAQWHTASESYARIVSYRNTAIDFGNHINPPCFRVWLKNGLMEEFGCTSDALLEYVVTPGGVAQYYISGWLLDMITDPQGNQIHFTYQRDMETLPGTTLSYPRDAVLSQITWDSPGCHSAQTMCTGASWAPLMAVNFIARHNTPLRLTNTPVGCNTSDANIRCDDPKDLSPNGLPAPAVQSTFVLDDIQVQVHANGVWNTLKDYQLSYEQNGPDQNRNPVTPLTDASTGKAESTAGYLDLTQIKVVGSDGTTALPTRTFGYSTVREYYEDDTYQPNSTSNCGTSDLPSMAWNTGTGTTSSTCILWSRSEDGNSRYLSSASNGMGLAQTFAWQNARSNMHGANNGVNSNPLACNDTSGNPIGTYPCDEADDQEWSHAVLTQQQG